MTHLYKVKNLFKIIVFLSSAVLVYHVLASSNGKTGSSTSGCGGGSCHGGSANSATTVSSSIDGNSWDFAPGQTKTITITVAHSSQWGAGFNASIKTNSGSGSNAGSLSAGTNSKIQSGEATHNGKKQFSGGSVSFEFDWTAPSTPGTYYLNAAGNAVNNSGNSGDIWNTMTQQEIIVKGLDLTSVTGGDDFCAGSTVEITWDNSGVQNVKIELSDNSGNSYDETIVASTSGSAESYSWDIPSSQSPGSNYRIRISDASDAEVNDVSSSDFSIGEGHSITIQPLPALEVCEDTELSLSVEAEGVGLSYQWKLDGNDISGANQPIFIKQNVSSGDAGVYNCVISSECSGDLTSDGSTVTILDAPKITSFPTARAICENGNGEIVAEATGSNLTYKWYKDGNVISGETSPVLIINNSGVDDEGEYEIEVISDNCGSVTSQACVLTIRRLPVLATDIQYNETCAGNELSFWVEAEGQSLQYKWYKDDQAITGANTSTYTIASFEAIDEGTYYCEVINTCGSVESSEQDVLFVPAPIITSQPNDIEIDAGEGIRLSVETNTTPLSYEWFHDGNPIVDSNISELVIGNATVSLAGEYYCQIVTNCNELTSNVANVIINDNTSGPRISLSTTSVNLGKTEIDTEAALVIKDAITNTGTEDVILESITIDNSVFSVQESAPITITPNKSIDLNLSFLPTSTGMLEGILIITSNAGEVKIDLFGEGVEEAIIEVQANVSSVEFDKVTEAGGQSSFEIVITNVDTETTAINGISLTNNSEAFLLGDGGDLDSPRALASQEEYSFDVLFTPTKSGTYTEQLVITFTNSNDIEIQLSGIADIINSVKEAASSLNAYPNPASNNINLSIELNKAGVYSYKIFDPNGVLVNDLGSKFSTNRSEKIIWNGLDQNGSAVSDGLYILLIQGDNNVSTLNIIIQK